MYRRLGVAFWSGSFLLMVGLLLASCGDSSAELAALEERVAALEAEAEIDEPVLEDLVVVEWSSYVAGKPWFVVYYRQANGQVARWVWEGEPGDPRLEEVTECYLVAFVDYQLPDCMRE